MKMIQTLIHAVTDTPGENYIAAASDNAIALQYGRLRGIPIVDALPEIEMLLPELAMGGLLCSTFFKHRYFIPEFGRAVMAASAKKNPLGR